MISRIYKHPAPSGAKNKDRGRTNSRKLVALAHVLIFVLPCAALTLGLGPAGKTLRVTISIARFLRSDDCFERRYQRWQISDDHFPENIEIN